MAREAGTSREAGHERYEEESGWWVGYGRGSKAGKEYQVEMDRIMAKEQKRNRVSEDNLDEKSQKVKRKSSLAVKGKLAGYSKTVKLIPQTTVSRWIGYSLDPIVWIRLIGSDSYLARDRPLYRRTEVRKSSLDFVKQSTASWFGNLYGLWVCITS